MTASADTPACAGQGGCRLSPPPMRRRTSSLPPDLLAQAPRAAAAEARIDARATRLVEAIRAESGGLGGIEDFLREYSLSTKEGLALMVLAEALLRVPDSATADRLIEDKLSSGDWTHHEVKSTALLVSASAWALGISARIINPGETPENILESLGKRLGLPAVRTATRQAMRLLGSHFVLGQSIEEALGRAAAHREFRYSYDMLGEGARTDADAERYFQSYARAIEAIGLTAGNATAARPAGHFGEALGAASALRGDLARARAVGADAARAGPGAQGEGARPQFHRRCRGGRPARTLARRDRRGAGRSVARRLGRLRARDPGLPEARSGGDRLGRERGARARPAADGAARQGRLLGHRGEARAGARACRLSGVHPQGDDRPLLHGVRAPAARRAAVSLSAVRHPQCADGRERDRGGGRRRGLRIPAPARHGRGALRGADRRAAGRGLPRLCAGRRASRSARLSGAAPAGKRRELVVRVGRGRSGGAGQRDLAAAAALDRGREPRAASAHSAAARSLRAGADELGGRRVRRPGGARGSRIGVHLAMPKAAVLHR